MKNNTDNILIKLDSNKSNTSFNIETYLNEEENKFEDKDKNFYYNKHTTINDDRTIKSGLKKMQTYD